MSRQISLTWRSAVVAACVVAAAVALLADCRVALAKPPCRYELFIPPPPPPCQFYTRFLGVASISPNGRWLCGGYGQCELYGESFLYDMDTGQLFTLPRPPGVIGSAARAVNDHAMVVGVWVISAGETRGYVYNHATGQQVQLDPLPGGFDCAASGINSSNVVCGTRSVMKTTPRTAFTWTAEHGFNDLGLINGYSTFGRAINEFSEVTGSMVVGSVYQPFIWNRRPVALGTLAGLQTQGFSLNDAGDVVGWSHVPINQWPNVIGRAFLWRDGEMTDLGTLPGHNASSAVAISPSGLVVGFSRLLWQNGQIDRAFVWHDGVMIDLNTRTDVPPGGVLEFADGISASGRIIVNGWRTEHLRAAFVLTPLPDPTADITGDCVVNVNDLLLVLHEWGQPESVADINGDGIVDVLDLQEVLAQWTWIERR